MISSYVTNTIDLSQIQKYKEKIVNSVYSKSNLIFKMI